MALPTVLLRIAAQIGIDGTHAVHIFACDSDALHVLECEQFYWRQDIGSVSTVIINERL